MKTQLNEFELNEIINNIKDELNQAVEKFHAYNSAHEGYAVILEELDELWDEIKGQHRTPEMYGEAKQVAATAIRFMFDICIMSKNPEGLNK